MKKKYFTEEERKAAQRETCRRWREKHPERVKELGKKNRIKRKSKITEYNKEYWQKNKEYFLEKQRQYLKTPMGRAGNLVSAYRQEDRKYNRGECTLTAQWILENIFTKKCAHCGKTGWEIIGCNRLDNTLPHTPDNVEPCCEECNKKLPRKKP